VQRFTSSIETRSVDSHPEDVGDVDTPIPPRQLHAAAPGTTKVPRRVRAIERAKVDDDGLTMAAELAITPAIFGFIGFKVDAWLGLTPLFTLVLAIWAFSVVFWMTWRRYDQKMDRLESEMRTSSLRSRTQTS
jgi:Flp pilus assembly protein TadB